MPVVTPSQGIYVKLTEDQKEALAMTSQERKEKDKDFASGLKEPMEITIKELKQEFRLRF